MLPKRSDFGGRNMPIVNVYGDPQGRSAVFGNAQGTTGTAPANQVSVDDFLLTRVSNYSIASVGSEVAEASKGDAMAFLQALKASIDGAMNSLSNSLETQLFRSGTGAIGTVGAINPSSAGTDVAALGDEEDIASFDVNQVLVFSATDGSALRAGTLVVTAVNRSLGRVTVGAAYSSVTTDGDFIYPQGDAANNGANVCVSGLSAWLPATAPSGGESFFGVDRSVDSRLYGQFTNQAGSSIEDGLITAASLSARVGGNPDVCFINHVQQRALIQSLRGFAGATGFQGQNYDTVNATTHKGVVADIGFRSVAIQGDTGAINVVAANKCPAESGFMLEMDKWILATLGEPVKFLNLDGNRILRSATADSVEARLAFRGNLGCKAPIYNVNIQMPAV
tara:strand:- start:3924 stop:5105 length:1182 start_codon:yes stop_codon:yes gene_type:complete